MTMLVITVYPTRTSSATTYRHIESVRLLRPLAGNDNTDRLQLVDAGGCKIAVRIERGGFFNIHTPPAQVTHAIPAYPFT